jgi:membrane protein
MRRPDLRRLVPPQPEWVRAVLRRPRVARVVLLGRRSVREFADDNCPQMAAAVSYHLLFSIFPLALVAVGALGLATGSPHTRDSVISELLKVLPLSGDGRQQLRHEINSISGTGGGVGLVGLVGVIWSASGVMTAVRKAVNIAWDIEHRRPFVRGKAIDLLLLAGTFILLAATLGLVLLASIVRNSTNTLPAVAKVFAGPSAVVFIVLLVLALLTALFTGLFLFLPVVPVRFRDALLGAVVTAVGTGALQLGFSSYVSNFAHYNRVYGSLGAIIAFLFFVYLASMVFLFGAEVASEHPRLPPSQPGAGTVAAASGARAAE